jgi:pyruvate,water dikinase
VEKPWREEIRRYRDEWSPALEGAGKKLLGRNLTKLGNADLAGHLKTCCEHLLRHCCLHFHVHLARIVPVGDFIVHAQRWTGASVRSILDIMRGHSPGSRDGLAELAALANLVRADDSFRDRVLAARDPEALLTELESQSGAIGEAARLWLQLVGHRTSGFDPGYPTLRETPSVLTKALKAKLRESSSDSPGGGETIEACTRLRNRVFLDHREEFDKLLEEARLVYFARDHVCLHATECFGILRLAALEAGRRLTAQRRIPEPEAALYCTLPELRALLFGEIGPDEAELNRRLLWRRTATLEDAPEFLGPPPSPPPPVDWLPPAAARMARAVDVYMRAMMDDRQEGNLDGAVIHGLSASGGRATGRACLVLDSGDFAKVQTGDVLVARLTTTSYNMLLPLLSGIVTDRGGILSHPAIVCREYGIPGVVGTRNGTALIPDGARVEIDGDAGVVRILP